MPNNQTIPITLTAGPVPPGFVAGDINQLMQAIAKYISGAIRADVGFFLEVATAPTTFSGNLIYNAGLQTFMYWDANSGRYITLTQSVFGDMKTTFFGLDTLATGWIVLDGRAIAAVPGLNGNQQAVLMNLFPSGILPNVRPSNTVGLPVGNAFGQIPWPQILPAAGVIGGLTFTNPVVDTEADALADDTEILRDTSENLLTLIKAIQATAQQTLTALNENAPGVPTMYVLMFIGF